MTINKIDLETEIKGIKCENTSCDFEDMDVEVHEFKSWVNQPCEKCGVILLSELEYEAILQLIELKNAVIDKS